MNGRSHSGADPLRSQRWLQLALTVVCMAAVANLQYGWTLFVGPIDARTHWGRGEIQRALTILVFSAAWLMPFAGYAADRFGARTVVLAGGVLAALAWSVNAWADSLEALYAGAVVGGIGMCCVYGGCIGHTLKWFSVRRGFAVGLTAAGFGIASAATVLPIHSVIETAGYERAFLYFGLAQGALVAACAFFLRAPPLVLPPMQEVNRTPLQVLATPAFWVMYVMFFLAALAGVMAIAQLGPIAKEYRIANTPVSILDLTLPALAFALAVDRVFSGLAKPLFGALSDRLGREHALCIAFTLEAVAIVALGTWAREPLAFVFLTAVMFLGWGQIYAVFPALCADTFGSRAAATHAGMLYTAKGAAALTALSFGATLLPMVDWRPMFFSAAALNALAALLAIAVLRPLREL